MLDNRQVLRLASPATVTFCKQTITGRSTATWPRHPCVAAPSYRLRKAELRVHALSRRARRGSDAGTVVHCRLARYPVQCRLADHHRLGHLDDGRQHGDAVRAQSAGRVNDLESADTARE